MTNSLKLQQDLEQRLAFRLNKNQFQEIERLIFEISRYNAISSDEILNLLEKIPKIKEFSVNDKLSKVRNTLITLRFPLTAKRQKIKIKEVFLSKIRPPLSDNWQVNSAFRPLKIFVEKDVKNTYLIDNFRQKFPGTEIEEINYYGEYLKKNKFTIAQLKKPFVFITKEKWDFIKPCPCTKSHLSCGYWIFNLGFGCPFDCSYCFLQKYTNFPGIILPANLDEFFDKFDRFAKKLNRPIRVGTGEFCDSLALDDITEYSKKLIPYFKEKNVLFELKTKSVKIENILSIEPAPNIIISWSLNPSCITKNEELGAPALKERLFAAKKVQEKGYRIGFHFDPIIYSENWLALYGEVVDKLYSVLNPPFAWISLGTLRAHRELKTMVELRFPNSGIFYGELLLGEDKKLRYPEFLRQDIYSNLTALIKTRDPRTPLYLCMENPRVWEKTLKISNARDIECGLISI